MSKWDDRYSEEGFAFGIAPNDFLSENVARIAEGGRVLCLAEGEGRNAVFLAKRGFEVVAVDSSAVGMAKAAKLAEKEGVEITTIVSDLADFEFYENSFDGIVSIFCHLPPTLRKQVNSRIVGALKPAGLFVLEAYTPKQLDYNTGGPSSVDLMLNLEIVKDEFSALEIIHAMELEREIVEGRLHTGTGAVVQFIGQK